MWSVVAHWQEGSSACLHVYMISYPGMLYSSILMRSQGIIKSVRRQVVTPCSHWTQSLRIQIGVTASGAAAVHEIVTSVMNIYGVEPDGSVAFFEVRQPFL